MLKLHVFAGAFTLLVAMASHESDGLVLCDDARAEMEALHSEIHALRHRLVHAGLLEPNTSHVPISAALKRRRGLLSRGRNLQASGDPEGYCQDNSIYQCKAGCQNPETGPKCVNQCKQLNLGTFTQNQCWCTPFIGSCRKWRYGCCYGSNNTFASSMEDPCKVPPGSDAANSTNGTASDATASGDVSRRGSSRGSSSSMNVRPPSEGQSIRPGGN